MSDERPLSELAQGAQVEATITGHWPWGVTAKIHGFEPVGASMDVIRRGSEPEVRRLAQELPPVGSVISVIVGEIRTWHHEPWIWIDLTCPQVLDHS
ncbi:siroheme synthase (precorrin-2 oxidase/ferrochelatase) [Streptacidiphilus sp. MAP12-33]|uniref:hypothetical protein n=1 Tax=Streptacidiphilus sp. MAP12-33 TaxID=3156266 RepID=UPI003515F55A